MIKKLTAFLLFGLFVGLYPPRDVFAEVVVFRLPRDELYSGTNIHKGSCYPMSLTENISAKVNGNTGAGCTFSVDVAATGEWVSTGDYYDTPPYAWGSDHFYPAGNASYSYTCTQPDYSIDEVSLPTYVSLSSVDTIAQSSSQPIGKRYHFSLSNTAAGSGSFSIPFSFTSQCTMKKQGGSAADTMTSVDPKDSNPEKCGMSQIIEVNPRAATLKLPIPITAACISPTPSRTPTPTPPPSCGTTCIPSDNKCPQNCHLCVPSSGGKGICMAPSPTVTPTPLPACGTKCVVSDNLCPENCRVCVPTSGGFGTCIAPSPTITPTPVPCNAPCSSSSQCDLSCAQCTRGANGGSVCKAGCGSPCTNSEMCPLACAFCAPNPAGGGTVCRLPASCNCDGIKYEGIMGPGQTVRITAFVKVENPDSNDAKALNMVFHVLQNGQEITTSELIPVSSPQRTTDQYGKIIDRYAASWDWTIPATGPSGEVQYRVFVSENCGYKSIASLNLSQQKSVVLGASDVSDKTGKNIFGHILGLLSSLIKYRQGPAAPTPTPGFNPQFVFESTDGEYYTEWDLREDSSFFNAIKLGDFNPFVSPTPTPAVTRACKAILVKMWY